MPSRESELYKDKIEVSLDGRQIFYLFFGGAVIVGMVFVLGVLVGRRVEARGHLDRADPQAATDPLAALDRLERSDRLSFHGALTGNEAPTDVEKAIGELEKRRGKGAPEAARAEAKLDAKADAKPEAKVDAKVDAKPDAKADGKVDARPDAKVDGKVDAKPEAKIEAKTDAKPDARLEVRSDAEPVTHPDPDRLHADKRDGDKRTADKRDGDKRDGDKRSHKHDDADGSKADRDAKKPHADAAPKHDGSTDARASGDAPGDKVRFTLQLSSFQDKSEAESFLGSIKAAGFHPYMTEAEVTGKGTFYRVRLGSYRSLEAANDAKSEYDKSARKTAQVMPL
jgi:cell division septation protein DedD